MNPIRTLIIHPNVNYNCGDLLTYYGTKALLTKAVGGSKNIDFVQYDDMRAFREIDTYISQYDWGQVDLIVLAGSPWLWIGCESTDKYRLLKEACARYPKAKVIGLGLGSCFSRRVSSNMQAFFWNDKNRRNELNKIFSRFNYILVRDEFAKDILTQVGIKSEYSYDTSIYSYDIIKRRKNANNKSVLFFYDPSKGVSREDIQIQVKKVIDYQINWATNNKADIYVNSTGDKETLNNRGISCSFSVDLDFLASKFTEYNKMLSGRIHMAILGLISGIKDITIIPIDTRFMTVLKFGIKQEFIAHEQKFSFNNQPIIEPLWDNIIKEENRIVSKLRKIIIE